MEPRCALRARMYCRPSRRADPGGDIGWPGRLARSAGQFLEDAIPAASATKGIGMRLHAPRIAAHPDRRTGKEKPFPCPSKESPWDRPNGRHKAMRAERARRIVDVGLRDSCRLS